MTRWRPPLALVMAWLALLALLVLLIAMIAISHGHVLWLALPLAFFFLVIRPSRCGQAWSGRFG